LPLEISNDRITFVVFAIWVQKPIKHNIYTEQVWNAVNYYGDLLNREHVILAVDFNSNTFWDKPNRIYNHSNLVNYLKTEIF
jgi:exodeoxyribonuclease III